MNHCIRTLCPMCSIASATLLSMSSSALHSIFSRAERACLPPLSPCAVIKALMTSSQPSFSGSFDNHSLMYSMLFKVTHNWEILIENTKTSYLKDYLWSFTKLAASSFNLFCWSQGLPHTKERSVGCSNFSSYIVSYQISLWNVIFIE